MYSILHITPAGWDHEADEPVEGGRTVSTAGSMAEAMRHWRGLQTAAPILWGPGHLVVSDEQGRLVYGPTLAVAQELATA